MYKLTYLLALALLLTTFGCSNDDEGTVPNVISVQDLEITIVENPANGQVLGTVEATQTVGGATLAYSITSQTPTDALNIDATTGELIIADAALFDFEIHPIITAVISVEGAENTGTVTISLTNANELSVENFTTTIDENPTDGQVLGTVQANGDGTLSFSITSQTPASALNINATTGELTVVDPNLFDFETNPVITADILVDNSGNTETVIATITLNDLDEVSAQELNTIIDENPVNGDVVGTIPATGGNLVFEITFQNPAGAFNINASTGELTVADAALFDYETNPNMVATVSVENSVNTVSVNASISLNNVNEIGDFNYGGIIFWIDPTSNNSSGLVVSMDDQSAAAPYGCMHTATGATGISIGTGEANTAAILAICSTAGTAADLVTNLNSNGFDDWFLPSQDEFGEITNNLTLINSALTDNGGSALLSTWGDYWTSTEVNAAEARFYSPNNNWFPSDFKSLDHPVRAVRTFTDF